MHSESNYNYQKIAICMATFNPPSHLFRRQVESIRRQTWENWHCFISDDASSETAIKHMRETIDLDDRFTLSISAARRGFFRNFERSLQMVPEGFRFFALADQDDFWRADKLERLIEQFDENTTLAYSDARIVDACERVISESAFINRDANCSDLASLVLSNSVTGAAALFSREVLRHSLPFPMEIERLAHDHWLACVAMACGQVKHLPLCLYDYVQHGENAIGFDDAVKPSWFKLLYFALKVTLTRKGRQAAEVIVRRDVTKVKRLAREILQHCRAFLSQGELANLQLLADFEPSPRMLIWLLWRGVKTSRLTAAAEYHLALGLWGQYLSKFKL